MDALTSLAPPIMLELANKHEAVSEAVSPPAILLTAPTVSPPPTAVSQLHTRTNEIPSASAVKVPPFICLVRQHSLYAKTLSGIR